MPYKKYPLYTHSTSVPVQPVAVLKYAHTRSRAMPVPHLQSFCTTPVVVPTASQTGAVLAVFYSVCVVVVHISSVSDDGLLRLCQAENSFYYWSKKNILINCSLFGRRGTYSQQSRCLKVPLLLSRDKHYRHAPGTGQVLKLTDQIWDLTDGQMRKMKKQCTGLELQSY